MCPSAAARPSRVMCSARSGAGSIHQPPRPFFSTARGCGTRSGGPRWGANRAARTDPRLFIGRPIDDESRTWSSPSCPPRSKDPDKDVSVYVNSPGGSLHAASRSTTPSSTSAPTCRPSVTGWPCPPGSLILAGGPRASASTLPNARILIHQPTSGIPGQSSDIEIHAREMLELRRRLGDLRKARGQDGGRVHEDMERDRFFGARRPWTTGSWTHRGAERTASGHPQGSRARQGGYAPGEPPQRHLGRSGEVEDQPEHRVQREQLHALEPVRLAVLGDQVRDQHREQEAPSS